MNEAQRRNSISGAAKSSFNVLQLANEERDLNQAGLGPESALGTPELSPKFRTSVSCREAFTMSKPVMQ